MTKDRFAQLCAETRIPAEIVGDLWNARAPELEADRGLLEHDVRQMLVVLAHAMETDMLPYLRSLLEQIGAHIDAGRN